MDLNQIKQLGATPEGLSELMMKTMGAGNALLFARMLEQMIGREGLPMTLSELRGNMQLMKLTPGVHSFGDAKKLYYATKTASQCMMGRAPVKVAHISAKKGYGVIATRDIEKGEIVTIYPTHYIALRKGKYASDGTAEYTARTFEEQLSRRVKEYMDYEHTHGLNVTDRMRIVGHPEFHSPESCGHMINDPYKITFKELPKTYEEALPKMKIYSKLSLQNPANTEFVKVDPPLSNILPVTAVGATRAIKKGEEITVTYCPHYWVRSAFFEAGEKNIPFKCTGKESEQVYLNIATQLPTV